LNPTLKIVGVLRAGDESLAEVALRRPSMPPWSNGWQAAQDFVLSRDSRTSLNNRSPSATRCGSRSTESGRGVMGSCGAAADELETSTPMRETFAGCCAATGKLSAKSIAQSVRTVIFLVMFFSALSTRHLTLDTRPFSLDHFIRSIQHVRRNRQSDLLRRFQIDDELKLRRLLHWDVAWLSALENLVNVDSGTAE
jgi:hypothetical protein